MQAQVQCRADNLVMHRRIGHHIDGIQFRHRGGHCLQVCKDRRLHTQQLPGFRGRQPGIVPIDVAQRPQVDPVEW